MGAYLIYAACTYRKSISTAECMRKAFVKHWESSKNASSKLEFYNMIKLKFQTETYLSSINNSSHRASATRLRISSHNLYIESGRYEKPIVPREARWCIYCFMKSGIKTVERELHALVHCPLYFSIMTLSKIVHQFLQILELLRTAKICFQIPTEIRWGLCNTITV